MYPVDGSWPVDTSTVRDLEKRSSVVRAAVLGCGVIGSSWIEAFLAGGLEVSVWDPSPSALSAALKRHGDSIVVAPTPEAAVSGAGFVQENGPEDVAAKQKLFDQISEAVGPHTVVASSTSTLQPSALQANLTFADRLLIGHPFNPPHIVPLVEVVAGSLTAEWAVDAAMEFYLSLGKRPIRLHRERPGHLANRLQAALWREAVDAVASGQATVEDVDAAVTLALGPRWALLGPFATFNLGGGAGGLAHFLEHLGAPFEALWDDAQRPVVTEELKRSMIAAVRDGSNGRTPEALAADRDTRLKAILAISARQSSTT
ncbi:3-hydroxyacyl-CoA dehydrogenase NAD-binding domain-containing protein [Sphingomonas sp. UYP23]